MRRSSRRSLPCSCDLGQRRCHLPGNEYGERGGDRSNASGEEFAALARLLLRAEGVASSFIEGVTAAVVDIVLAEGDEGGARSAAAWVAANLAAVTEAIDGAHDGPLDKWKPCSMTCGPPARLLTPESQGRQAAEMSRDGERPP